MSAPAEATPYLDYAVRWRTGQAVPGRHTSRISGSGGHFRAYRPFWQVPDAQKIDVRRSIMDPFGEVMVRQTDDRGSISVIIAADISRSMQPSPGSSNLASVARLAEAAASSAHRAGDSFGLIAFDTAPTKPPSAAKRAKEDEGSRPRPHLTQHENIFLPPSRSRGAIASAIARLSMCPERAASTSIADLATLLPARRSLIILASDFLFPLDILERALSALARHDIAPIVFHEAQESELPRTGLLRLRDAETGERRLLLMRPALARRWQAARAHRQKTLDALFLRHGRPAFHVHDNLDLPHLGQHLLSC